MKQHLMKMISLCFAIVMLLCTAPIAFAQECGEIIESYNCDDIYNPCDFSWDLYADGTLIINGYGSLTNHMIVTENAVKKIIISDTVSELSADVFLYLKQITYVEVSDTHPSYTSSDGVLFSKDCSVLLYYPRAKSAECYTVPATVKTIGRYAFYGAQLESVVIPSNVQTISMYAFQYSMLESVSFEGNSRNLFIDQKAFADCANLVDINLTSQTLYGISCDAFDASGYYKDESNWDGGVIYINDILLAVDDEKTSKEYTIKDGTKIIADYLMFLYKDEEGDGSWFGDYEWVNVSFPQSVDTFGMFSLMTYDEFPKELFRCGRFLSEYSEEQINILNEWIREYDIVDFDTDITVTALKALPEEILCIFGFFKEWVHNVNPYMMHFVNTEVYKFNDIKKFVDDNTHAAWVSFCIVPTLCDGYIFSENLEFVGRFSPLNEENTIGAISFAFDGTDVELEENLAREKSLTFLNPDCYINDAEETIWHGYTICGYPDSTAYEYAMKYNRKFVDISNCSHSEKALKYTLEANCSREGYSGDVYCQYCGEFLEEGTIIPKTENHSFGEWEIISSPSCVEDGTRKHICELCGKEETGIYQTAYGHKYAEEFEPATCTSSGFKLISCENCSWYDYETLSATGHKDENNDYKCDVCGEQLVIDCSCNCHKSGFMGFIYKITQFFWRLFRINQVCGCGAYHY